MAKVKRDVVTPVLPGVSMMLGSKDMAAVYGMYPEGIYQLRNRGVLPDPDDFIGGDPVWHAWTVELFGRHTGRNRDWAPGVIELAEAHWMLTEQVTEQLVALRPGQETEIARRAAEAAEAAESAHAV